MERNSICLFVILIITILVDKVFTAGNFELQILEISNTNSHLFSGYCCGVTLDTRSTKTTGCSPCSTAFRLCLKEYQSSLPSETGILTGCSFGNATTGVLGGSSFALTDPEIGSIILPFTFRWTKSFTLILQALDMYNTSGSVSEQLIEETSFSGVILPSPEWKTLDHKGKNARITYRVRVLCAATYYNTTCTTFCRSRNDQFGHYTCGEEGNKVCLPGWQGANCEEAICKPGCDPVHGKCDQPGGCECRPGWRGPLCNDCMVYPGCKHGSCNGSAWQCLCDTNWGGILCDQDLNYCGTHEPCMHGGTCENTAPDQYRCTCSDGLSGIRCEIVEHPCATLPCKNGGTCILKETSNSPGTIGGGDLSGGASGSTSQSASASSMVTVRGMRGMSSMGKPVGNLKKSDIRNPISGSSLLKTVSLPAVAEFSCTCSTGWTGKTCEINIDECAGGPCEHGGTCIDLVGGFRCECPPEWTGNVCQYDVDECKSNPRSSLGPCINAKACHNTPGSFFCTCQEGWGGSTCAKDIDDCIGQCKNGATCIDLVNDYHCACALGYTGRDCETDINECANSPCRNGGECVDMIGNFKCICPVGFSGTLCEEAKDHCTPSPCIQGSCLNTPGGYYCHCMTGRSGKHCELTQPPCDSTICSNGCSPATNDTIIPAPCSGHGKCDATTNGLACQCHSGYTGLYCEHNLNECSPNPCKNGGICLDGDGDFTCECTSNWTGKICTERPTQCVPGQCMNGGSCVPINGVSQCLCTSGWGGQFCTDPVDQCQGQPCHNGGTCESGTGWFRCVCAQGFSGPDCRINVNECSPQPCLGGGTCQDGIGGFTCVCAPGRIGVRCEILLSDPASVCLNSSSLTQYVHLNHSIHSEGHEEANCNACVCQNGRPKCTKLWCGLPNCLSTKSKSSTACQSHEVCVPALRESCLSPPCSARGDCRALEPSRRVAPPKLPANPDCWPNQAILNENCARISILLELKCILQGASVENICYNLRTLLAARLINHPNSETRLIILCDIKTGNNDTIEVTISSSDKKGSNLPLVVRLMSEMLSRHSTARSSDYHLESVPLTSILEVKVETALVAQEHTSSGLLVGTICAVAVAMLCFGIFLLFFWRQRLSSRSGSGAHLSPSMDISRHEEEKSNNLQNEENLRRYENPLKGGSTNSLRGAMELSMTPIPEVSTVSTLAGPSALHRSQPLYPSCETDFDRNTENPKIQHRRSPQILLHKTPNTEMHKNTMTSIDNPQKDFGKASINCQSIPSNMDSEVLTVHV